jgi:RHS repeat-associated protein
LVSYAGGVTAFRLEEQWFHFTGRRMGHRTYLWYLTGNDAFQFATYCRDGITGLDYAEQRYYSSVQGRFLSADRYQASAGPTDPGSWNRYAYVEGDPVNRVDPSGLFGCNAEYSFESCFGAGGPMWHGIMAHEEPYRCWTMIQALLSNTYSTRRVLFKGTSLVDRRCGRNGDP